MPLTWNDVAKLIDSLSEAEKAQPALVYCGSNQYGEVCEVAYSHREGEGEKDWPLEESRRFYIAIF